MIYLINKMKEILKLLILVSCIVSCASLTNIAPGYIEAFKSIKVIYAGYEDTISKDTIEQIPYASALLKIGKGPKGLIILESKVNDTETWVSADNVFFNLKNGKIIATAGLPNNLVGISEISNPNWNEIDLNNDANVYSYYSYDYPALNNLRLKVIKKKVGEQKVDLLMGEKTLTLYEEEVSNEYLGWNFKNQYWVDKSGFIWKSKQYLSTKLPIIEIEVTKKPAL